MKSKKAHIETTVTAKAAFIEGGPKCPNLIEASVYNKSPVHCIIIVPEELKWVVNYKECFNIETGKVKISIFLRMNNINKFNDGMGGVDISDKRRKYYRIYFWVRKKKWWWYIFFRDVDVILKNAYIIYIYIHNMHGTPRKQRLSQNNFRKTISHAWINIENLVQSNLKFIQKYQLL